MSAKRNRRVTSVFICYRRDDSAGHAGHLHEILSSHFTASHLFMDVDSIKPGEDWVQVIRNRVAKCDVLLAIIGKGWLKSVDSKGDSRIHNPKDPVRVELDTALTVALES